MPTIQSNAGELEPHPDVALVERVRGGDVSAYDSLVRKYERQLFRIAQSINIDVFIQRIAVGFRVFCEARRNIFDSFGAFEYSFKRLSDFFSFEVMYNIPATLKSPFSS